MSPQKKDPIFAPLPQARQNITKRNPKSKDNNHFKPCQACSHAEYEEDDDDDVGQYIHIVQINNNILFL